MSQITARRSLRAGTELAEADDAANHDLAPPVPGWLAATQLLGAGPGAAAADLAVSRRMLALAPQHPLLLRAHSDVDCIERLLRQ